MSLVDEPTALRAETDTDPYVAPRLEVTDCPRTLSTFDGFAVAGRAHGSRVEGAEVEVSVADVMRTGRVEGGRWLVRFEDGALSRRHMGVRPVAARVTDTWFNQAHATRWVNVDEFVDGFVHVDRHHVVTDEPDAGAHLVASGELGLGTHEQGRELVVMLVCDDAEGVVVSTGLVEPGWHHGEWRARLPLSGVVPGVYRVRALLTDKVCAGLTRLAAGRPFRLA
ncbi:hypothetical protein ET495_11685 [Xylanimonas allomyrinae]|uniref:Uncharacterized protein n=1 Tax=Xylanimonas allomyrinae TaxID=2509459 RepID=A0A4V0YED1_9MICO|nr:hypothetical protein [Xylanimonas allomyrinae]QAY63791.1 hypothetical protein ET495_11685 [Xylanimonas allomyrinae]